MEEREKGSNSSNNNQQNQPPQSVGVFLEGKNELYQLLVYRIQQQPEIIDQLYEVLNIIEDDQKKGRTYQRKRESAYHEIPLEDVSVDLKSFQNRRKPYSEYSVQGIIQAVRNGEFKKALLSPCIIRRSPAGNNTILSGHSRNEAFIRLKELSETDPQIQQRCNTHKYYFNALPCLYVNDINFEEAKTIALMSNALATAESDIERANVYRCMREIGKSKQDIEAFGKKCEKSNWPRIHAYSYLHDNGSMMKALDMFELGQDENNVIKRIALRIGNIRKKHPELTHAHEEELYTRLLVKGGYGNQKGQVNNQSKCMDIVNKHIETVKVDGVFDTSKPLNILKDKEMSFALQQYYAIEKQLKEKKQELYTEFHTTRRQINKSQVAKNAGSVGVLNEQLKSIIQQPIDGADKIEQVEILLFDIKEFVDDNNILNIKNYILNAINTIEQQHYAHRQKKIKYDQASKCEIQIDFPPTT